jgi:hypothetical protein
VEIEEDVIRVRRGGSGPFAGPAQCRLCVRDGGHGRPGHDLNCPAIVITASGAAGTVR